MKRFELELSDKIQYFLDEGAAMRFVAITYAKGATLEVTFGGNHSQRPQELIDVDEFIAVKSHRAKGKRLSNYDIATLRFIEPEYSEEELTDDEDVAMDEELTEDEMVDIGDMVGDDVKADPDVDYSLREQGDDAGFSASQLDLFS